MVTHSPKSSQRREKTASGIKAASRINIYVPLRNVNTIVSLGYHEEK